MALQLPIAELQYVDASGSKGTIAMRAQAGATYADIAADAESLAAIIAPLTSCRLVRLRVIFKSVVTPLPAADDSSPITRAGAFFFQSADGEHQALAIVPGILESLLTTTEPGYGVLIDTDNADVVAFVSTALELPITDPFGNEMASLLAAYRQSRT